MTHRFALAALVALLFTVTSAHLRADILANSITASEIAAATITGAKIAATTITASNLSVSTLSAISANLGTISAGTITGITISGSTIYGGSGNEVSIDSNGLRIADWNSDDKKAIVWAGGAKLFGFSDTLALRSGAGAGLNVIGGSPGLVEIIGTLYSNAYDVQFTTLGGGGNLYVCTDTTGKLFAASSC